MYWDMMMERLNPNDSEHVSGTVTVTQNTAFGHDPDVPRVGCEIRVSWTPLDYADGGLTPAPKSDSGRRSSGP